MAYFKLSIPTEGVIVRLVKQVGHARLFASDKFGNPNPAFYDYNIDEEGEILVEMLANSDRKRFLQHGSTLYITVKGIDVANSFQVQISPVNIAGQHYYYTVGSY